MISLRSGFSPRRKRPVPQSRIANSQTLSILQPTVNWETFATCSSVNGTAAPGGGGCGTSRSAIARTSTSMPSPRECAGPINPGGRGPSAGGRSLLLWIAKAAGHECSNASSAADQGSLHPAPRQPSRLAASRSYASAAPARPRSLAGRVQTGRVGQLDRPALHGSHCRDHVAGCAGRRVYRSPAGKAQQGVDETAFAHVGPAGNHHLPRPDEETRPAGRGPEAGGLAGRRLPAGFLPIASRSPRRPAACPMILIEQDCGRPLSAGLGQGHSGGGGDGSFFCRAAHARQSSMRQPCPARNPSIMATAAWPPWQCRSTDSAEFRRTTTSSPGPRPKLAHDQPVPGIGLQRPAAPGAETGGHCRQGTGPSIRSVAIAPRPGGVSRIRRSGRGMVDGLGEPNAL